MAYDESYPGGPTGPVASIDFVEKSIEYAIKNIPPERVVLGIPFYGRYWKEGEVIGGIGISQKNVYTLLNNYHYELLFDEKNQSPVANVIINYNDPKITIGYKTLSSGKYTIWFENDKSIKSKLRLVEKYNLKGVASWSLGQETAETWDYFELWLNGNYFKDIKNHWAEEDILNAGKMGWMKGVGDDIFKPDAFLTRAEASAVLVRVMGLADKGVNNNMSFNDVPKKHWAYKEIIIAKNNEVIIGDDNGNFYPDRPINRQEMAAILDRIINPDEDNIIDAKFKDLSMDNWAYDSKIRMVSNNIFKGYEDGTFRPKEYITRAQMAALINRISKHIK